MQQQYAINLDPLHVIDHAYDTTKLDNSLCIYK